MTGLRSSKSHALFLSRMGLLHRINLVPGDFYKDEFPKNHDLPLSLPSSTRTARNKTSNLFLKIFRSLDSGGRIIIRDHVMDPDRTRPKDGAIFAVNMFVATAGGNTYTFDEIKKGSPRPGLSIFVCSSRESIWTDWWRPSNHKYSSGARFQNPQNYREL